MAQQQRLFALDVFRGIIIAAMILVNFPGSWKAIYAPLKHAKWEGLTPTDFIFPFFIFIVGVSIALAYTKQLATGKNHKQLVLKTIWRSAKIFSLGVALRVLPTLDFTRIQLPGVLQRIALVFLVCALLFLFSNWKNQLYIGIGILVVYWISMISISVPGFGAGVLEPGKNLANWLDGLLIPASLLNKKGFDAEGILSTLPAIVTGISGLLAGRIILNHHNRERQILNLFLIGTMLILSGYVWSWFFPIIKKIWTSSFVLVTSGWAFIIFALLIWLVDIRGIRKGTKPWIVFGSNAIAIFVLADVFETIFIWSGLRIGIYSGLHDLGMYAKSASLVWAVFSVAVCYLAGYLMYVKKIFIKL